MWWDVAHDYDAVHRRADGEFVGMVGQMYAAAFRGAAETRAQHWRDAKRKPRITVREGRFRGLYVNARRRAATTAERSRGIPVGWFGR